MSGFVGHSSCNAPPNGRDAEVDFMGASGNWDASPVQLIRQRLNLLVLDSLGRRGINVLFRMRNKKVLKRPDH